jgi:hypothetical protein
MFGELMKKLFGIFAMALLFIGVASGQAISQSGGSIQGSITDPTGAKIPGALVTITSPDTGYTRSLQTDSSGFFSVGPINPGPYKVSVTAPGLSRRSSQR